MPTGQAILRKNASDNLWGYAFMIGAEAESQGAGLANANVTLDVIKGLVQAMPGGDLHYIEVRAVKKPAP